MGDLLIPMPPYFAVGTDLSGDHPPFPIAPEAVQEFAGALERSETHYTDVLGITPLREEVARILAEFGLGRPDSENVMITAGEQEARFVALQTLARAGYTTLLPSVVHPGALKAASIAGRRVERLTVDESLAPRPADVRAVLERIRPAALYLEVPNRLSGRVTDGAVLEALLREVTRSDAVAIIDAGAAPWLPADKLPAVLARPETAERTFLLGALFPGTGIDGWLSGYLTVPKAWVPQARSLKQIVAICTSAPVQWASLGALRAARSDHAARRERLRQIKIEALESLPECSVLPGETATILAVNLSRLARAAQDVPIRGAAGDAFGMPGTMRLAVTPTGEVVDAAASLAKRLDERGAVTH